MTEKKCDGNCCDSFFEDYDDIEDDYDIDRLEDIIKICEFLIQTKKHRKQKRETFKKIFESEEEEEEEDTNIGHTEYPFRVYRYRRPKKDYWTSPYIPYWDQVWF